MIQVHDAGPEIRLVSSGNLRIVYTVAGWFFVALGVIGIFLPILPTTPFLLLATACFARGSESAYLKLINNPYFGPSIRRYRATGCVPIRAKVLAICLIVASMGTSIAFFVPVIWGQITMGAIGLGVIVYLLKLPTLERNSK